MSRRLERLGSGVASSRPRWNCVDSRLERMPPSAPAVPRKAGSRIRTASAASRSSSRFSTITPATRSSSAATTNTGTDWRTISRNRSRRVRNAATRDTATAAASSQASTPVRSPAPASRAATTRAGTVAKSPRVPTSGAITLSRSHPKRTEPAARPRVARPTPTEANRPPHAEMTTKSASVIVGLMPNTMAVPLASMASTTLSSRVSTVAAMRFCPTTPSGRRPRRKVPAWTAVPRRLPMAPKTFPRRAIAPGTSSSSPGSSLRVSPAEASTRPPTDAARTPIRSATNRWRVSAEGAARGARRAVRITPVWWTIGWQVALFGRLRIRGPDPADAQRKSLALEGEARLSG